MHELTELWEVKTEFQYEQQKVGHILRHCKVILYLNQKKFPSEALYLETGLLPIHIIIRARRLNYLHHLTTRDTNETLHKVFKAQWDNPVKNDWVEQVKDDLKEFDFIADIDWVKKLKKSTFSEKVKIKSKILALYV